MHFSFRGTEDPACMRCVVTCTGKTIGWVRKVAGGWGYRSAETEPWVYGSTLRGDAAAALYAIANPDG